jgi:CheY-like chemotaxis protein
MKQRITIIEGSRETQARLRKSVPSEVEIQLITAAPFFDEGIEKVIIEFDPNLIVLDLSLMDNIDSSFRVLKRLKQSNSLRNVPVVLCSMSIGNRSVDKYKNEALKWGVVAVIPKIPFPSFNELLKYSHDNKTSTGIRAAL